MQQPLAYYCDHEGQGLGQSTHMDVELIEGHGWQVVHQPETVRALDHVERNHLPEHLRGFHCPDAMPLYPAARTTKED